jgi:5-formyltetrahydrofolate cyclo-ligase
MGTLPPSLVEEKRALRRAMRERRASLPAEERAGRSRQAAAHLLGLPEFAGARAIAGFSALPAELDPAEALAGAERRGAQVSLPRVSALRPRLRFHRTGGPGDLRPGPFGLSEPSADCPEVAAGEIDLFLVPGLAFDAQGRRLGNGGGYYDELAEVVRRGGRGLLVAVGFDFQLVETCPAGEGDAIVDCVVTDSRVVRCRAPGGGSVA